MNLLRCALILAAKGIGIFGRDLESDKIIEATLLDGAYIICNAFWFTSETTCEGIPLKNISNPENSELKWKIEFKSTYMWSVKTMPLTTRHHSLFKRS